MARDDGKRYGAGGSVLQEIVEPSETKPPVRRGIRKKAQMLEERLHDNVPSDTEPMEEESNEKI
tara:strand:- start:129 stop:320 length:192 start_codon:yes stop_codon:yes gene_type:complete